MYTFYQQVDSPLHRLNPLSKMLAILPAFVFVALTTDPWTPLAFVVLAASATLIMGRIPVGRFMRVNVPLVILLFSFLLVYPLTIRPDLIMNSPVIFRFGPITLYQEALYYTLDAILRAYALCLLSLFFSLTTDSSDFIRAMVQQWRFPYRFGYGALAAFRFVPMLEGEFRLIQAAHKIRGVTDKGGLRVYYDRMRRYAVPLLATAIRRAERTALAMDGRAFGVSPRRTYYKRYSFHTSDYIFFGAAWLACLLIILILWYLGLMGPLSITKIV